MQATKLRPGTRRGGVIWLPADELEPNPVQPRKNFPDGELQELSESIAQYGILNPLTVRVCLLDEIKVAPLKIFDKGNEARVLKPHVQQDARHLVKTGKARGTEPSLARDKLVSALAQTHRERV